MLVFAAHSTERVKYILNFLLTECLGIAYDVTDNPEYFRKSHSQKINYSHHIIEGCINIPSNNLLFQDTIVVQKIEMHAHPNWHKYFFKTPYKEVPDFKVQTTFLPFDLLSASFYLLSRYEEYLNESRDEHNRFKPQNSIAFKEDFLSFPLVDYWVQQFAKLLKIQYPEIVINEPSFKQINTIDIDFAFKYKGLGLIQRARKFSGSLLKGKVDYQPLFPPQSDPYDTYDFLIAEARAKNIETLFFFLLADYGAYDKNIPPHSKEMKSLVNELSPHFTCGLHPSYKAGIDKKLHIKERSVFKSLFSKEATHSRHHFLKVRLPESYRELEKFGATDDYTMAYSSQIGWRASTCHSFLFYDLPQETTRNIRVHSPCVMDVTLRNSLDLNVTEAQQKIAELKTQAQKVNGEFISIWHNSNFDETQGWSNWKQVYQSIFE
jgi:hypothetical protein